jgi:hypothetical protein
MLCAGQQQMAQLGYSPLPLNLVQGGLLQANQIPGHVTGPNPKTLAGCNNPTFTNGVLTLLKTAPQPSPCDKLGAPLNCVVKNGKAVAAGTGTGTKASSGAATGGATSSSSAAGAGSSTLGPGGTAATGPVSAQVVNLASDQASQTALGVLTALGIIAAVVLPPALGVWLRRRKQAHG